MAKRLVAVTLSLSLLSGCNVMYRHPVVVGVVPVVAGPFVGNAYLPMDKSFDRIGAGFGLGLMASAVLLVAVILAHSGAPENHDYDPPICTNAECDDYSYSGPSAVELTAAPDPEGNGDRPRAPVFFDNEDLEPWFAVGTDEVSISASSSAFGPGDLPIHNCASAKWTAYSYLAMKCPSIRTITSHLRAYRVYAGSCSCAYSAGSTYCTAEVQGVCAIDGSNTAAYASGTGTDRGLTEEVAVLDAERDCARGHPTNSGSFGCMQENGEWVCFAHAECMP